MDRSKTRLKTKCLFNQMVGKNNPSKVTQFRIPFSLCPHSFQVKAISWSKTRMVRILLWKQKLWMHRLLLTISFKVQNRLTVGLLKNKHYCNKQLLQHFITRDLCSNPKILQQIIRQFNWARAPQAHSLISWLEEIQSSSF